MKEIVCQDEECDLDLSIPASVVPFTHFFSSVAGRNLTVRYQNTPSPNLCFSIDRKGKLGECGWLLYPSLRFYNWQAQWLSYEQRLRGELALFEEGNVVEEGINGKILRRKRNDTSTVFSYSGLSVSSTRMSSSSLSSSSSSSISFTSLSSSHSVINVFDFSIMQGKSGVVASFSVPPWDFLRRSVLRLQLDASLSCPGDRDEDCPPWDHTIHLTICCDIHSDLCGAELGRWITPFRRRVGRWLTDVTPMLPLLRSPTGRCNVTMKTVWWAKAWRPALRLLLTSSPAGRMEDFDRELTVENVARLDPRPIPSKMYPLFTGGTFDANYNSKYVPMYFLVPENVVKVVLVSVITGHGSDENQCGEFCPTSHVFYVNDKVYNNTFEEAGTQLGCAETVLGGSIPNEHGTWLYGRGGWCDGRQVDPLVIDVTDDVRHGVDDTKDGEGRKNGWLVIDYKGYFQGIDPDPKQDPGKIIMQSFLTFYTTD